MAPARGEGSSGGAGVDEDCGEGRALLALSVDERFERGHGFGMALILFAGALVARALHGADAVPDDGDLAGTDCEDCGDLRNGKGRPG